MLVADAPALIDQVKRGPITIFVGTPSGSVVILRDGIGDIQIDDGLLEILQVFFIVEFRVMIADNYKTFVFV